MVLTIEKRKEIIEMWRTGNRIKDIAKIFEVSDYSIDRVIKEFKKNNFSHQETVSDRRIENIPYVNIREMVKKDGTSLNEWVFSFDYGRNDGERIVRVISGKQKTISLDDINDFLRRTGMKFEEAFKEENE